MSFTLEISDRVAGVPLKKTDKLPAPVVTPAVGQDQLGITWSKAAGGPTEELVEFHLFGNLGDNLSMISNVIWDWDDGSPLENLGAFGLSLDVYRQRVYTSVTPRTITATIQFSNNDIELDLMQSVTPVPSGDYDFNQVQIEKYENDVLLYRPDWNFVENVATAFNDQDVRRGFAYKYRIRARKIQQVGLNHQLLSESAFSDVGSAGPWV